MWNFIFKLLNSSDNARKNEVAIPPRLKSTMLVCGIGFFVFMIIACVVKGDSWIFGAVFCAVIGICFLCIALFWTLWRIRFDENGFEYRNYLGIKKRYDFKDLELWEHPNLTRWKFLKSGKRVVSFTYINTNCDELIDEYLKNKKGSK